MYDLLNAWRNRRAVRSLLPLSAMHHFLQTHQALALRHGCPFSLVTFQTGTLPDDPTSVGSIAAVLAKRKRTTDIAGWLQPTAVGVILPQTETEGAQRFTDELVSLANLKQDGRRCVSAQVRTWCDPGEAPANFMDPGRGLARCSDTSLRSGVVVGASGNARIGDSRPQ
jgi:hypothetical protein